MNLAINLTIFTTILFSHLMAARPFYLRLRHEEMPSTIHFATISVIIYYDLGLGLEALNFPYESNFFISLFSADEKIIIQAFALILFTPWLFALGATLTNKYTDLVVQEPVASLKKERQKFFYFITSFISIALAIFGYRQFSQNPSIWSSRQQIGETLGPFIILLYLPTCFLGFYVRLTNAKTQFGLLYSLGLTIASILSTFAVGQRNTILVPLLILTLFRAKINITRITVFVCVGVVAASALLPIFKWQYSDADASILDLVGETINGDFSRSPILKTALEMAEPVGTSVMPYPLAGYVYALLYYVPRSIVPFKGWSTAQYFTSELARTPVEDTTWGFGVGAIEEILLNAGLWLSVPGLIVYGMCMGMLDKLSGRIPSLVVSTRLAAIWLCGYDLVSLLITFGTMAIISFGFHYLFVQQHLHLSKDRLDRNMSLRKFG